MKKTKGTKWGPRLNPFQRVVNLAVRRALRVFRVVLAVLRWLIQRAGVRFDPREIYLISSNFKRHSSQSTLVFPGFSGPEVVEIQHGVPEKRQGPGYRVRDIHVHAITRAHLKGSARFNAVFAKNFCLVSERLEPGPWDFQDSASPNHPGHVSWQSRYFVETTRPNKTIQLEKGIESPWV